MSEHQWFVYIAECSDGSLYTGITINIDERIEKHNAGLASKYTRSRRPIKLVYSENHPDRRTASKRERAIKALPRDSKLQLVEAGAVGNFS